MKVRFRVQHEVISGLRYLQLVKRKGIKVDKSEEMMVCRRLPSYYVVGWRADECLLNRGATGPIPPKIRFTKRLVRIPLPPELSTPF